MEKKSLKTPNSSQGEAGSLPEKTIYEKPEKVTAIKDKTGWEVRPENKMIWEGSQGKGVEPLIPFGFEQEKCGSVSRSK